ncbi:MAG: phosphodiester glycosidase family protein [Solobacterium sp.]|nr:phosphodiester glycosidase family protein [Solobacterium sp.]
MFTSEIKTYTYTNKEIQRVQILRMEDWHHISFFQPAYAEDAFRQLCDLYSNYMVKKYAYVQGTNLLFTLPDDLRLPWTNHPRYGVLYDPLCVVSAMFRDHILLRNKQLIFKNKSTEELYHQLQDRGCIHLASGKLPILSVLPVRKSFGFLSQENKDASMKVNVSFFTMNSLDIGTVYDSLATSIGLCVQRGEILNPPLFDREVFTVDKQGKTAVRRISLKDLDIRIGNKRYRDGENCRILYRPEHSYTPRHGYDLIVVGRQVTAFRRGGGLIPSSGFVIHTDILPELPDTQVRYGGLEDMLFAVQAGNSAVINGIPTNRFLSSFHDLKKPWIPPYPPTLYPLDYARDRAPRIVIGADMQDQPMILWFEGAGKYGYQPGKESCGASLKEAAEICAELGMKNGVHLDGGGSAQILCANKRELLLSDRDPVTYEENERAVVNGLIVQ